MTTSCVNRHTNLFTQYFQSFSSAIWSLLAVVGPSIKYQDVAVSSLHFFSSVCTKRIFRGVFQSGDMLKQLIANVIVPNCIAQETLLEQFEVKPNLFIKNYEEVEITAGIDT